MSKLHFLLYLSALIYDFRFCIKETYPFVGCKWQVATAIVLHKSRTDGNGTKQQV